MDHQIKERCIYCGADVYYVGTESLIKCGMCGHTLVVAKFENELARMNQAVEEGEQAKKDLAEAEKARQDAEAQLLEVVEDLAGIKDDQDVLSTLMQSVMAGQRSSEDKLAKLKDISDRILKGQGDLIEGMAIFSEIKGQLENIGLDQQAQRDYAKDFVNWFQDIHVGDITRLEEIGIKSSKLLVGQKVISDKIDSLRSSSAETQRKLDSFHSQWKESQLEELRQLYHQAENYQHDRMYDKAYDKYEQVITKGGGDAEVMWRLLLCHYCVSYQADDKGNLIPIILNPDLTAPDEMSVRKELGIQLEKIPIDQQNVYKSELSKIDHILGKYRYVRGQANYDVFISVRQQKNSNPTRDSFAAVTLFNTLRGKGLRVFNSRLTPPPAGQEYEPYIISALMSAKAMIVVGTCTENMQSQWVKNEWSRFQWLQKSEKKLLGKTDRILLCYLAEGMKPEEIPLGLNPSFQAIIADITAEKQLMEALKPLFKDLTEYTKANTSDKISVQKKDYNAETLQDILNQMTVWLLTEDYDEVIRKHTKLKVDRPFMYDPRFHLYALCAQKKVEDIDKLAQFGSALKKEGLFKLALKFSKGTDLEHKLLTMTLSEEEKEIPEEHENKTNSENMNSPKNSKEEKSLIKPFETSDNGTHDHDKEADNKSRENNVDYIDHLISEAKNDNAEAQHKLSMCFLKGDGIKGNSVQAFYWCQKSAIKGNREAQYDLAKMYQEGIGTNKSLDGAAIWYRRAAEQGHIEAAYLLGYCYEKGNGLSKNYKMAKKWYLQAAENGFAKAQFALGKLCFINEDLSYGREEAVKWLKMAADNGIAEAQYELGTIFADGALGETNYFTAFNYFQQAADQGFAPAEFRLGDMLMSGKGSEKDVSRAVSYYQKSAKKKHALAQYALGDCYAQGLGLDKDDKIAMDLFESAKAQGVTELDWLIYSSKSGNIESIFKLGLCYLHGNQVEMNLVEAASLLETAAVQGHREAQYYTGKCYYYGNGVEQDKRHAFDWFLRSARQGNKDGQLALAKCFQYGNGTIKNYENARYWYGRAAESGSIEACYFLALCYENDLNYSAAFSWFLKAAEQGWSAAQLKVSEYLHLGKGVTSNSDLSFDWLKKAASQNNADALYKLGMAYYTGGKVQKDYHMAMKYFELAAVQNHLNAMYTIGELYRCGEGVEKNLKTAFKWYQKAASAGHSQAQYHVGMCYKHGKGVQKDETEAEKWFSKYQQSKGNMNVCAENANDKRLEVIEETTPEDHLHNSAEELYQNGLRHKALGHKEKQFSCFLKAAEQGHALAQMEVGSCFKNGYGVKKDLSKTIYWYRKANEQGISEAVLSDFSDYAIDWKEEALEKAMREITGISAREIMYSDVMDITELDLSEKNISDISALGNLINLTKLSLSYNKHISHISALGNLINLKELDLSVNDISDISALGNLTNLKELDLSSNNISDISALGSLTSLISLNLAFNQIVDISALSKLSKLTGLYLEYNSISDISALKNLTSLNYLDLEDNLIDDFSPIAGLNIGYLRR